MGETLLIFGLFFICGWLAMHGIQQAVAKKKKD